MGSEDNDEQRGPDWYRDYLIGRGVDPEQAQRRADPAEDGLTVAEPC